jgi:NlpC/P60 family putative phage cell wall peptidase
MTADRCSAADGAAPSPSLRHEGGGGAGTAGGNPGRRAAIVAAARSWIGTPYRHQASCKGVGADCLGLIRGVWREVLGAEPAVPPAYTPDWAEATGEERLFDAAVRHLVQVPLDAAAAGDVLLFRLVERGPAKHAAILTSAWLPGGTIVHAYSGHAVCETRLTVSWSRRLAGAFRFPGA